MNDDIKRLERQIERIKRELQRVGELRPGSLSEQYNVCGTPSCRCKASPPQKHGPYHQLSYTRKGRSRTRFIRPESLSQAKKQIANYTQLRTLIDRWIDLATELADHKLGQTRTRAARRAEAGK